jgi:hypothetical protein
MHIKATLNPAYYAITTRKYSGDFTLDTVRPLAPDFA